MKEDLLKILVGSIISRGICKFCVVTKIKGTSVYILFNDGSSGWHSSVFVERSYRIIEF